MDIEIIHQWCFDHFVKNIIMFHVMFIQLMCFLAFYCGQTTVKKIVTYAHIRCYDTRYIW